MSAPSATGRSTGKLHDEGFGRIPSGPGGRAALVVGATAGIGVALSDVLAAEGFALSITGRRQEDLDEVQRRLTPGTERQMIVADLSEPESARNIVDAHLERFGRLDVLVVAAGDTHRQMLAETRMDLVRRLLEVNIAAVIGLLSAALPAMRAADGGAAGARVVLLSSVVGHQPVAGYATYSASKAALSSLVRSVNEEEAVHGVRATAICPGFVDTPMTRGAYGEGARSFLPVQDIAEALRFLLRLSIHARVPELEISRVSAEAGRP